MLREMARLPGSVVDDNRTVVHPIHDDEPDTSDAVVRALLGAYVGWCVVPDAR